MQSGAQKNNSIFNNYRKHITVAVTFIVVVVIGVFVYQQFAAYADPQALWNPQHVEGAAIRILEKADLDLDGSEEIILVDGSANNELKVMRKDKTVFTGTFNIAAAPVNIVIADIITGDGGKPEIIVPAGHNTTVSGRAQPVRIFKHTTGNTLVEDTSIVWNATIPSFNPTQVAYGDMTNDGVKDIIIAPAPNTSTAWRIYTTAGGRTDGATASNIQRIAYANNSAGNRVLIITVNNALNGARLFNNDGNTTSDTTLAVANGNFLNVAVGDTDNNAATEEFIIATDNATNNWLAVVNANGTIRAARQNTNRIGAVYDIKIAEVTGDSNKDIILGTGTAANAADSRMVKVLSGTDTQNLTSGTDDTTAESAQQGTNIYGVEAGEVDGNTATDDIVAALQNGDIKVFHYSAPTLTDPGISQATTNGINVNGIGNIGAICLMKVNDQDNIDDVVIGDDATNVEAYTLDKTPPVVTHPALVPTDISDVVSGSAYGPTTAFQVYLDESAFVTLKVYSDAALQNVAATLANRFAATTKKDVNTWVYSRSWGGSGLGANADGTYYYTITATDNETNTYPGGGETATNTVVYSNASMKLKVDFTAPFISLTAPAAGATGLAGNVTIAGIVYDPNKDVADDSHFLNYTIDYRKVGETVYTPLTTGTTAYRTASTLHTWNTASPELNGNYVIRIVARDKFGHESLPVHRNINIKNDITPPNIALSYWKNYNSGTGVFSNPLPVYTSVYTKLQSVFIKVEANETLQANPTIAISGTGANTVASTLTALTVNNMVYVYNWNVANAETLKAYTVSVAAKDKGDNNPLVSGSTSVVVDSTIANPTLSRVNGLGRITLNWTNSEGDHVAYHVFRSTSTPVNTGGVPDFVVSGPRSTWDDTTVAPHVTYYYKIKSVDAAENVSAESNEVSGVAPPGPPTLTVQYYSDASYTQLLPRDAAGYYHAKAQNVYIRVSSNKALTGAPNFSIDAPLTVNDVAGRAMTLEGGNVYRGALPWSVFAGVDGNAQITFKGATAEGFDFAVNGVSPVVAEGGVVKIDTAVVVPTFILIDYGNQKITVKWNSNTDYSKMRIYRSNTSGFTANAGTLVGTTVSGEIYEDGPPTSGIWYYKLIAEDLAGNLSSVSEEKSKFFDKDITPPTLQSAESTSKQLLYLTFSENISINSVGGWTFTKYVNGVAGGNMAFTVYASAYELVPSDNRIVRITFNDSVFGNVYPLPISYRIVVNSVYDQGGLPVNPAANFAYWDGYTPHGKYAKVNAGDINNTRLCGQCHVAHGSIGRQLLNRTTIQQVCFVCHGTAGTSLYKVQGEFARSAPYSASLHKSLDDAGQNVLFCTDCHNPHGEKKPGTNNLWAKLLKVPGVANSVYGNNFCLACHGPTNRIFKTGLTMNSVYNATTYYGYAAGDHTNPFAVHYDPAVNSGAMLPVSGTQVTCVKCHEKHGSQYGQLKDNTRANAEEEQCYKCHGKDANYSMTAGYNVYNMVTGAANKSRHTVFNTVNGKIECTSCHGPHTVDNAKFVSGAVYTAISDPDNTKLPYNTSGSRRISQFCIKCHDSAPPTAITNATTVVPYSITFNNPGFTTGGGGWNKDAPYSYLNSGHYLNTQLRGQTDAYGNYKNECTMCHEWHGTQYKWLVRLDEDKFGTDGVCLQCHQGSLYTAPTGITSLNVKSPLALTYSHPTTQAGFAGRHSNTEQYPWTSSGVSRHAQCNDCHDPHTAVSAKRSVNDETYLLGNVTGVNITNWNGATWANWATTTPTWSLQPLTDTSKQWQLCIKCHSKFAYGLSTTQDATGTAPFNTPSSVSGYPPGAYLQTDIAKEFNPANSAYHAVIGPSKAATYVSGITRYYGDGMYVNGWHARSTMKCTDCHNKAPGDTGGRGPHGSSNRFLLIAPWNPTGAAGTLTGTTGTNSHLCFQCHNWNYYAGGTNGTATIRSAFKQGTRYNLHADPNQHATASRAYGCAYCHGGLPHGWRYANPLWGADAPRPYRDGVGADMPASATGYTVAPGADWGDHTAGNCAGACGR